MEGYFTKNDLYVPGYYHEQPYQEGICQPMPVLSFCCPPPLYFKIVLCRCFSSSGEGLSAFLTALGCPIRHFVPLHYELLLGAHHGHDCGVRRHLSDDLASKTDINDSA